MKGVAENDVAKQIVPGSIVDVESGVHLEIAGDVAGKADGRRVFRATYPIDLRAPGSIEIVSVTENRLVLIAGVNCANDEFLMFGVITGFDVRLWIDIEVRRPVQKSDGQQVRFFR